jgi:hypothetical protein
LAVPYFLYTLAQHSPSYKIYFAIQCLFAGEIERLFLANNSVFLACKEVEKRINPHALHMYQHIHHMQHISLLQQSRNAVRLNLLIGSMNQLPFVSESGEFLNLTNNSADMNNLSI